MAAILTDRQPLRHPVLPDNSRPSMAKANVRTPDIDWSQAIGAAIQDAVKAAKWSNKQAAAVVGVDDAEFGKWLNGTRRPQFDRLFKVAELRGPLVIAFATLVQDGIEIVTEIRVKRSA